MPATILWADDLETGDFSKWYTTYQGDVMGEAADTASGVSVIDTAHAHSGTHSIKMTTNAPPAGGNQAARNFRYADQWNNTLPDEAWYSTWFYFDQLYTPATFWIIMQWKTRIAQSNSNVDWSVNVYNTGSEMRLYLFDYHRFASFGDSGPGSLTINTWHEVTVRYRYSRTNGLIQCWLNGNQWYYEGGVQTQDAGLFANFGHYNQWSVNNYTDQNSPAISNIWADDAQIWVPAPTRLAAGWRT